MGADFIEPDLVSTKDHVLVARHEPEISGTTDVASRPEFAGRRTTKLLDGVTTTGWFTEDFTVAELKTLYAVERLPQVRQHHTLYNGLFQVPTFAEVLALRARLSRELGRCSLIRPTSASCPEPYSWPEAARHVSPRRSRADSRHDPRPVGLHHVPA